LAPSLPVQTWLHRAARHALAVACLAAAGLWLVLPLTSKLGSHVPGVFPGDNVSFVWDTWWFRRAFAAHSTGLWCDLLFARYGTSLLLHTHAILQTVLGLLCCPTAPPAVAQNVILIAGVIANGICTYALAFHYTRRSIASLVAGTMFTWCAFVTVHLAGHFNLVHAWVLPLEALCAVRFLERPSRPRGVALGAMLAAIAYSDYYFLLYGIGTTALLTLTHVSSPIVERRPGPVSRSAIALATAAGIMTALAVVILWSGGWVLEIGGVTISMRGTRTLAIGTTAALLIAGALTCRFRLAPIDGRSLPLTREWVRAVTVFVVLILPLIVAAVGVIAQGGYASQPLFWRSSPPGVDLATLVQGPPRHLIFGEMVTALYHYAGISSIEQSGWISLVGMLGVTLAAIRYRDQPEVRAWLLLASVFFLIAVGPFVRINGIDTGIPGPFALLRYLPGLSNARMPGRAMVVVQLAAAILAAGVVARRAPQSTGGAGWLLFLIIESFPHPTPLLSLPRPDAVDASIAASPVPGAVLELPAGMRDGFGMIGFFDHRTLIHQMRHERPVVGGFVARLSQPLREQYLRTPIFASAFGLSVIDDPREASLSARDAAEQGVAFLVVNRDALHQLRSLTRETLESQGFRFVLAERDRELYATGCCAEPSATSPAGPAPEPLRGSP
jgi:hypothetical protein